MRRAVPPLPAGGRSTTRSGAAVAAQSGAAAAPVACAETPTAASPLDKRRTPAAARDAAAAGCKPGSNMVDPKYGCRSKRVFLLIEIRRFAQRNVFLSFVM